MLDRYINQARKELQESFGKQDNGLLHLTGYKHYRDKHKKDHQAVTDAAAIVERFPPGQSKHDWPMAETNLREV